MSSNAPEKHENDLEIGGKDERTDTPRMSSDESISMSRRELARSQDYAPRSLADAISPRLNMKRSSSISLSYSRAGTDSKSKWRRTLPTDTRKMAYVTGSVRYMETTLVLTWKDIKYSISTAKNESKVILKGVSGEAEPGEMLAIMGSSGAGKTTLLNILAGRVTSGVINGEILVNNAPRGSNWKHIVGYVEQDDVMYNFLTVKETIEYAALLRLPTTFTVDQKKIRAEHIINQLGLSKCANTIIGREGARGISGGERKRVSIGIELVTNPRLLFLDEPTSGLDSCTAYNIIELLSQITKEDLRTFVLTIHQPRSDIFFLFDKLLLLAGGATVYYGNVRKSLDYFSRIGYPTPELMNPSDHFLDIITIDYRTDEAKEKTTARVIDIQNAWLNEVKENPEAATFFDGKGTIKAEEIDPLLDLLTLEQYDSYQRKRVKRVEKAAKKFYKSRNPWIVEFLILLKRSFLNEIRDHLQVFLYFFQTIIMLLFTGFTFFQLGLSQASIQARLGVLFFAPVQQGFLMMVQMAVQVPMERAVIFRERYASTYSCSTFYVAKAVSALPLRIIAGAIYALGIYYIVGLKATASAYFIFFGIIQLSNFCAQAIGLIIGAASPSVIISQMVAPVTVGILMLFAGQLVNPATIPPEINWIQYIDLFKWDFLALCQNEFTGLVFQCYNGQFATPESPCTSGFSTGEDVINAYNLGGYSITTSCLILLGLSFGFQLIAYITLLFMTRPKIKLV